VFWVISVYFNIRNTLKKSGTFLLGHPVYVGRDSSVGIETRYGLRRFRNRILVGVRFSAPIQTGPGAHPASCTMGTGSFPGVKAAGA